MTARGIVPDQVKEAIKKGSKELQGKRKVLHKYKYYVVVTKKVREHTLVITVKPRW